MDSLKTLHENHQGKVSDKWTRYLEDYDHILTPYRNQAINLLEIGVQNGGSLEVWAKYFPQASHIIGCDIDKKCQDLHYDDPRIQIIIGDAGTEATKQRILTIVPTFDIIIDDGSHTSGDIVRNFAHYFDRLNDNGTFIIEDLHCSYWQEFDGGLYHPYSAINFLKNLADIVNHEHWGLPLRNSETLEEICQRYDVIAPHSLAHIHSVEFINSVCVIKKRTPNENELGVRIIAGQEATVVENKAADCTRSIAPSQINTFYPKSQTQVILSLQAQLDEMQKNLITMQKQNQQDETTITIQSAQLQQLTKLSQSLTSKLEKIEKKNLLLEQENNQSIQHLRNHISHLDNHIAALQNYTANLENKTKMQTKLWTFRLFKPLFNTERAISSGNRYRKDFRLLVQEKGSIGKAYQHLRRICKVDGLRAVKHYLRTHAFYPAKTIPNIPAVSATLAPNDHFDICNREAYQAWVQTNDTYTDADLIAMRRRAESFTLRPKISVLMPVYNVDTRWLSQAIDSVRTQTYENWELCISDDASPNADIRPLLEHYASLDPRIKVVFRKQNGHISENSNSALDLVTGKWLALMDHDDLLPPHALFEVVSVLQTRPDTELIYSDEDKVDEHGKRFMPHFKSDFNLDLLYSQNYISHLGVYKTDRAKAIGGFRKGLEGSQDYDFLLRYLLETDHARIVHIPKILYHWRAIEGSTALAADEKSYTTVAGIKALENYFVQTKQNVTITRGRIDNIYRVQWHWDSRPLVSLIIPTYNGCAITKQAIDSILDKTTYTEYEILLVDNNSDDPQALSYFDEIAQHPKVKLLRYPHPFNYSAINNFAVKHASGSIIGLINNDIEVIDAHWLDEMVSQVQRPDIGCVGAMLYYPNDTVQHAGVFIGINGVAAHSHKHYIKNHPGYFARLYVTQNLMAVTAACLLVRKSVFEEVGGLNEKDLPVAFNDVDFCLKVHYAGYRNLWTPYAQLYHHESVSRGYEDNPEKIARFKNEVRYMMDTWHTNTLQDPYYNPNLTLNHEDFSIPVKSRAYD